MCCTAVIDEELEGEDEDKVRPPPLNSIEKNDIMSKVDSKEAKESDSTAQSPVETTHTVKFAPVEITTAPIAVAHSSPVAQEEPDLPNIQAWRSNSLIEESSGVKPSKKNVKRVATSDTNVEVVGRIRHTRCTIS